MNSKNNFCIITPDRGDRPKLLEHCKFQMERQTLKPGEHFIIDFAPRSYAPDLIERINDGLWLAKDSGYDIVFIIENDDYYPDNYLETMMQCFEANPELEAVGMYETLYYHILSQKYYLHRHPGRSSLFCTGFKISALEDFQWPESNKTNLDVALWSHFKRFTLSAFKKPLLPIGIKHGLGLCGGNGHNSDTPYYNQQDMYFHYLQTLIRPESLNFYQELALSTKLQKVMF